VGRALSHLLEVRLDHGPMDPESALAALDEWWAQQPEFSAASDQDPAD
jgi:poly(A) polymerase